ncbi:oxygenase MpaB family protein [Gordonia sp. ABSL1-1]|uniref:oxygenase MpaB family protein n=1 Tax=Gordonia sp. ABSL1-1 TaxID=3053923 RepID=UPI0025739334|nr:oxygenase MpaB family protein [Gordonia sp. ABSL1-1]MDL9938848.1 oxygenase MpaB family protein [Gordonia sp. ABSL1-1]
MATQFRRHRWQRTRQTPTELTDLLTNIGAVNNVANIIMQLSLPGVGHGVNESRVVSGSPRRYPIKRTRTTTQFLALALVGTDHDRDLMRSEIQRVHRAVVSTADSPVRYSGNSPELQKWVAACLFRYYLDQYTILYGPLPEDALDSLVRSAAPLATGVQVRAGAWPTTWAEFQSYWDSMIPALSIAPEVKHDFETLADVSFVAEAWGPLGRPAGLLLGKQFRFMTRGTLPPEFRELMGWSWTDADQRRFDRAIDRFRTIDRVLNPWLLVLLYKAYVWDFRLRRTLGLPVLGRLKVSDFPIRDGAGRRLAARVTSPPHAA